jgi:hypothetical protein
MRLDIVMRCRSICRWRIKSIVVIVIVRTRLKEQNFYTNLVASSNVRILSSGGQTGIDRCNMHTRYLE